MDQISLLQLARRLKPGYRVEIHISGIIDAAGGDLSSLLFDQVRNGDIKNFVEKVNQYWGVKLQQNFTTGNYTMIKPQQETKPCVEVDGTE
jgi:hypothetical protein